jgi:hypothetical protein
MSLALSLDCALFMRWPFLSRVWGMSLWYRPGRPTSGYAVLLIRCRSVENCGGTTLRVGGNGFTPMPGARQRESYRGLLNYGVAESAWSRRWSNRNEGSTPSSSFSELRNRS